MVSSNNVPEKMSETLDVVEDSVLDSVSTLTESILAQYHKEDETTYYDSEQVNWSDETSGLGVVIEHVFAYNAPPESANFSTFTILYPLPLDADKREAKQLLILHPWNNGNTRVKIIESEASMRYSAWEFSNSEEHIPSEVDIAEFAQLAEIVEFDLASKARKKKSEYTQRHLSRYALETQKELRVSEIDFFRSSDF